MSESDCEERKRKPPLAVRNVLRWPPVLSTRFSGNRAIIVDRAAQPFMEIDLGLIAQRVASGGNVGQALANVADARRRELRLHVGAQQLVERVDEHEQTDGAAVGNVKYPSRDIGRLG